MILRTCGQQIQEDPKAGLPRPGGSANSNNAAPTRSSEVSMLGIDDLAAAAAALKMQGTCGGFDRGNLYRQTSGDNIVTQYLAPEEGGFRAFCRPRLGEEAA